MALRLALTLVGYVAFGAPAPNSDAACSAKYRQLDDQVLASGVPVLLNENDTSMVRNCMGIKTGTTPPQAPHAVYGTFTIKMRNRKPNIPQPSPSRKIPKLISEFFDGKFARKQCVSWNNSAWQPEDCEARDVSHAKVYPGSPQTDSGMEIIVEGLRGVIVHQSRYWERLQFTIDFSESDYPYLPDSVVQDLNAPRKLEVHVTEVHVTVDGSYMPASWLSPPGQYSYSFATSGYGLQLTEYCGRIEAELKSFLSNQ